MGNLFSNRNKIDQKYFDKYQNNVLDSSNIDTNLLNQNIDLKDFFFERLDTYNGLFNSQQLLNAIDFNQFQNHCFFDSAVSKVEYTFNKIFDEFPIDGTQDEFQSFFYKLDGFSKLIYSNFDKNLGYLKFNNSYIEITNKSGYLTSFNRNEKIVKKLSSSVLNPKNSSFSFDFRLFIDNNSNNENQVIFQYLDKSASKNNGFTCYIKNISVVNNLKVAEIVFNATNISNNDQNEMSIRFNVDINKWNHICIVISNSNNNKKFEVYNNTVLLNISNTLKHENISKNISFDISNDTKFYIGKGVQHSLINNDFPSLNNNINTLNAFVDEFRFYHNSLTQNEIILYKNENIYASDSLKLYFKFNEPTGKYEKNMFCFDSSGNSLHSKISLINFSGTLDQFRQEISNLRYNPLTDSIKPSLLFENDDYNPCLMPTYQKNKDLNLQFLSEAKDYDNFNPNLIFKLFPKHYFNEGAMFEGLNENVNNQNAKSYYIDDANSIESIQDEISNLNNFPGQQKSEGIQTFAKLLLIWARFFDEIKIFLDIMPKLIDVSYSDIFTKSNETVNFFIPLMTKLNGFEFKEFLNDTQSNKILDGYIIGSDGIDKSQFTLRYVQNEIWKRILINSKDIIASKGTKSAIKSVFNSVGINYDEYYRFREYGKSTNKFIEKSIVKRNRDLKFLSFYNQNSKNNLSFNIKNLNKDYFKDSFTFEFILNYNLLSSISLNEKILTCYDNENIANKVFAIQYVKGIDSNLGNLILKIYKNDFTTYDITLTGVNILENKLNYINISHFKNNITSDRVISLNYCDNILNKVISNQIIFTSSNINSIRMFAKNVNNQIIFENTNSNQFIGNISCVKLWKNKLNDQDIKNHILNPFSISNDKYQLLQLDNLNKYIYFDVNFQDEDFINNNFDLLPIDYSENNMIDLNNKSNYNFVIKKNNNIDFFVNKSIITYENNFRFDEPNSENKVIPVGFFDEDLILENQAEMTPAYQVNYFNKQRGDVRFSIEMSNVKHLNEDIGKIFNSIDFMADIISDFGNLNDMSYQRVEKISDLYFKRLKNTSLNIVPLYEIYSILDNILTDILNDFISSRVKFNNNVYVIESHAFERHKFNYKYLESHIVMKGDLNLPSLNNSRKSFNYLNLEGRKYKS